MKFKKYSFLALILVVFSCQVDGIYKSIDDIKDGRWFVKQTMTYNFEIKDESKPYNVYYYVRNSLSYQYYNLYLAQTLSDSSGKSMNLDKLKELTLFDPITGKPLGDGLGDIFDHKVLVLKDYKFTKKGKYSLKLIQNMRQDPLVGILSVGVGVEDATLKAK